MHDVVPIREESRGITDDKELRVNSERFTPRERGAVTGLRSPNEAGREIGACWNTNLEQKLAVPYEQDG